MKTHEIIITNSKKNNLKEILSNFANKADCVKVAAAFFSDTDFIIDWLDKAKKIDLVVSLRPPTNYYSLKKIHYRLGINIQFLGDTFHSKYFIFYFNGHPFASIIGSSNFTAGGLCNNIETNAILTGNDYLKEIDKQFSALWNESYLLQPTDLEAFKHAFDNFQKRVKQSEKEQKAFEKKILANRGNRRSKSNVGKEAKQYLSFWRVIDNVKGLVNNISEKEYPNVPVYIAIDHFWYWIKNVWTKKKGAKVTASSRSQIIPKLFKEYCEWDKKTNNYTMEMVKTSKAIFEKFLSQRNIDTLTKDEARQIYSNLHSGAMRTRRFGADEKFVSENSIQRIRDSLKYLLYSSDEIDLRIHNLCNNPEFQLNQFKSSATQEVIGWVMPDKFPLRNDKADSALILLGFTLE